MHSAFENIKTESEQKIDQWKKKKVDDNETERRQNSDIFVPARRHLVQRSLILEEQEIQKDLKRLVSKREKERAFCKEQIIVDEIKSAQQRGYCEEKRRLQLRLNSTELRELEHKLRAAYFRKDNDALLEQKKTQKELDRITSLEEIEKSKEDLQKRNLKLEKEQREKREENLTHATLLRQQYETTFDGKQREYEEFLRDKLLIDEALRKVQEEDQQHNNEKMRKKMKTLNDLREYQKLRDLKQQQMAEQLQDENIKADEFVKRKDQFQEFYKQQAARKIHALDKVKHELTNKLLTERVKKLELDEAREELRIVEQELAEAEKEKMEIERKQQIRRGLHEMFVDQLVMKADTINRLREEEKEFQFRMLEKVAEEEKCEKLFAEKRLCEQLEYRAAMEQNLADKKAQFALHREQELLQFKEIQEMEKKRLQMIEMEKRRLLKEHEPNLSGYLPNV